MRSLIILFCYLACGNLSAQVKPKQNDLTGEILIRRMHQKYFHGPCKCYTFSQKNTHFRNDSAIRNSEWHEAVEFPDKFRINFGNTAEGNFVLFKNDSAFNYKAGELFKKRADTNSLLLLIGGMFYRDIEDVLTRVKNSGYKTDIVSEQTWNGEEVYVVGARVNDLVSNQLWISKKTLYILRIIEKMNATDYMDMRFETHKKWCAGFIETKVSFRRNGKLEQVEEYYDIKIADAFPVE